MSYQVNIGTNILYYPGSEDAVIYDSELNQEVGLAGEFKFKVPSQNPQYSQLATGALITILKNDKEFWRGEIRSVETDFAKVAHVYALEDLAWLADEFMTPAKVTNETYAQRFQAAITAYNTNRGSDRQFTVGYVSNVTSSNTCNWQTEYEWSILDSLRECICNASSDSGYLRVRRSTTGGVVTRYIDIVPLSQYGTTSNQTIEYGYNLLDYVEDMDYSNLTNVLTPYGDELDSEVYTDYNARLQGTTITNAASVSTYGRHAKAVVFDNVDNLTTLNSLAASYLSRYCQPQLTMKVQAVDLSTIENVDDIGVGDSVRIIAQPFSIDQTLYLTQIRRDIQNIDKNTITMSGTIHRGKSITSQINKASNDISEIPSKFSVLEAAKKNALSMLLDETQGGYVVFEYDANNENMEAINICDQKTISESLKRWRWSQNGLGYMYRNSKTSAWSGPTVAITNDGKISANFITTGSLNCDRLNGGTISGQAISGGTISGAKITSSGTGGALVTIEQGGITSNSLISCSGLTASNVIGNNVSAPSYSTSVGSDSYSGASGQISWAAGGLGYSINVKNGIVVGIAQT